MAPRPPTILSLMSSTSYPPVPNVDDLVNLQQAIMAQSAAVAGRLTAAAAASAAAGAGDDERRGKKDKKQRERESTVERERAALAANERAGMALEAVERRRVDVPGDSKIKRERGKYSLFGSNGESVEERGREEADLREGRPRSDQRHGR